MSTLWAYDSKMQKTYHKYSDMVQRLCADAILNKKLMKKLRVQFDVLRDAISPCAVLLAKLPTLPLVYSLRFTTGNTYEKLWEGLYDLLPTYLLSYFN